MQLVMKHIQPSPDWVKALIHFMGAPQPWPGSELPSLNTYHIPGRLYLGLHTCDLQSCKSSKVSLFSIPDLERLNYTANKSWTSDLNLKFICVLSSLPLPCCFIKKFCFFDYMTFITQFGHQHALSPVRYMP